MLSNEYAHRVELSDGRVEYVTLAFTFDYGEHLFHDDDNDVFYQQSGKVYGKDNAGKAHIIRVLSEEDYYQYQVELFNEENWNNEHA